MFIVVMIVHVELSMMLDTVVISGNDACCSVVFWHSGRCVCV